MKIVYIAGPFRGKTTWQVEQNVRHAETVGLEVARMGAMPMIPHTNTRFFDGELPDEFWLKGTLALLERCDAIVMVGQWQLSTGAMGELTWATEHNLPHFYEHHMDALSAWIRGEA